MTDLEQIFQLIEAKRKALGLSQAEVGRRAFGRPDTSAIQNLRRGAAPSFDKVSAMANALGLELYLGEPREHDDRIAPPKGGFALVPRLEAELAAGPGAENGDETASEALAFRSDWLRRMGVAPSNARLVKVRGDSMEPLLHDRDLVMIDRGRRSVQSGRVYAFVEGAEARVKRLDRPDRDTLVIRSDNPAYAAELKRGPELAAVTIIGQVVWSGHEL